MSVPRSNLRKLYEGSFEGDRHARYRSLRGDPVDEACPGKEQTGAISEIIMEFATLRSQRHGKETLLEILS